MKLRIERRFAQMEKPPLQQYVAGAAFPPVDHKPRRMAWAHVELALYDPLGRRFIEVSVDWSEHAVHAISVAGLEQAKQPGLRRKFVVVDEGDEVPGRVFDGLVPRQANALPGLRAVRDRNGRCGGEIRHYAFGGSQGIVVGNHDRIGEKSPGLLLPEFS